MQEAPRPVDEEARLQALRMYEVLDTAADDDIDDLTLLAAHLCQVPIALVSLVDVSRQWFKAKIGIEATETSRTVSFCAHAILQNDVFVVPDAQADRRFADNPLVTGEPGIRFYAGAPLITPDGYHLGTLCVIDRQARSIDSEKKVALQALSRQIVRRLESRRHLKELHRMTNDRQQAEEILRRSEERLRRSEAFTASVVEHLPNMVFVKEAKDLRFVRFNRAGEELLGYTRNELIGKSDHDFFPREEAEFFTKKDREVLASGRLVDIPEEPIQTKHHGTRILHTKKIPLYDEWGEPQYLLGISEDITERKRAQEAVERHRRRLALQIAEMPLGHIEWDLEFRVTSWNRAAERIFGYAAAEATGRHASFLIPEDQHGHVDEVWRRLIAGDRAAHSVNDNLTRDGRRIICEWTNTPLHDEGGRVIGAFSMVADITERTRTREQERVRLEQLERQQAAVLALIRDPLFRSGYRTQAFPAITERAARTLAVERVGIWLYDETRTALVLSDLYEATPKRHTEGIRLSVQGYPSYFRALESEPYAINADDARTDPRTSEFATSYLAPLGIGAMLDAPIHWGGQVVGVLCLEHVGGVRTWTAEEQIYAGSLAMMVTLALDTDERRRFQQSLEQRVAERTGELQEANQALRGITTHLQTLLEESPLAIIELDEAGRVTNWNSGAVRIFGWTESDVLGRELPYVSRSQEDESSRIWDTIMNGTPLRNVELRRRRKDGSFVDVTFWGVMHRNAEGGVIGSIGFMIDSTQRRRLEEQFRQAQKMEAVGRLAGGVAHDFNNLLTVINGSSALLLDQVRAEDPLYMLAEEILRSGERAAGLTRQLLAFSRQQVLQLQRVDLNESLRGITSLLQRLIGEDVELGVELASDLWPVQADKGQIDQVLMNLAVNARDAMPDGGRLTIATANFVLTADMPVPHPVFEPGDYVHVTVRDTGQGMDQDVLSHLFEPFYTTKPEGKGTGLGLAMVYGVVKQSRGYVFVDSAPGQGATFNLYFPRMTDAEVAAAVAAAPKRTAGSERVLVVEDQGSVRRLIVQALAKYGYEVFEAGNGEEALRLAAAVPEPVQVLVTDVVMPHLTGPVIAERLRAYWPGLRVLFMSGYTERVKPVFLSSPGTLFIQKPFLPADLAAQLRHLLDEPF